MIKGKKKIKIQFSFHVNLPKRSKKLDQWFPGIYFCHIREGKIIEFREMCKSSSLEKRKKKSVTNAYILIQSTIIYKLNKYNILKILMHFSFLYASHYVTSAIFSQKHSIQWQKARIIPAGLQKPRVNVQFIANAVFWTNMKTVMRASFTDRKEKNKTTLYYE